MRLERLLLESVKCFFHDADFLFFLPICNTKLHQQRRATITAIKAGMTTFKGSSFPETVVVLRR
jgi:hypothetical protein